MAAKDSFFPVPFPSSPPFFLPFLHRSLSSSSYPPISSFSFPSFLLFSSCFSLSSPHFLLPPCHALSPLAPYVRSLPLSQSFPSSLPSSASTHPQHAPHPHARTGSQGLQLGWMKRACWGNRGFSDWLPRVARQLKYRPPASKRASAAPAIGQRACQQPGLCLTQAPAVARRIKT